LIESIKAEKIGVLKLEATLDAVDSRVKIIKDKISGIAEKLKEVMEVTFKAFGFELPEGTMSLSDLERWGSDSEIRKRISTYIIDQVLGTSIK
jgi:hypothetical protein